MRTILFLLFCLGLFLHPVCSFSQTVLANTHAHNDYWHARPLMQAVGNGFMSVEADCHLIDGRMLVAHEKVFTKKGRTLQKLYLDKLYQLAKENDFKSIYKNGPAEFVLYIDIKADCKNFIPFLDSVLKDYNAMLTRYTGGTKITGAVRVLVDHCGDDSYVLNSNPRYLSLSGNISDADKQVGGDVMPRISFSYNSLLNWKGKGQMPEQERQKLRDFIQKVHANGYTLRMWAAGNNPAVWKELVDAGADWINVDRLKRFRRFMETRSNQ